MGTTKNLSRLGALLAGVIAVTFAGAASASTAVIPSTDSIGGTLVVRTVVVGGMPGWQIAAIAIAAALVTGIAAVLVERGRTARRRPVRPLTDASL